MMPIGYEFGFRKQVNVVHTMPATGSGARFDLRPFVTRVNALKLRTRCCRARINKARDEGRDVEPGSLAPPEGWRLYRVCRDDAPAEGEAPTRG
jgi:hypothetical protein